MVLLAAACTLPTEREASFPPPGLRVMTFNIRYGKAKDGPNAWPERRELVRGVIEAHDPQVLGLQEALRFQLDEIAAWFPHLGEVGVGARDGVSGGEHCAILYDRRRLEVLEEGTLWLSDTPDVPGSATWGNSVTRIVTWALFSARAEGRTFLVYNTHWDHRSQPSRMQSYHRVRTLVEARQPPGTPALVLGDFNAGEGNPAFTHLVAGPAPVLIDTFRQIHPAAGRVRTYHAFEGSKDGAKIDAVLVTAGWEVIDADIDHANDGGRYPSDHYPVWADVRLDPPD